MLKSILTLAAATMLAVPALAETFTHEGVTYVYTVTNHDGYRIIKGEDVTNRRPFELKVSRRWVDGHVDNSPVSFSQRDVISIKADPVTVAAR